MLNDIQPSSSAVCCYEVPLRLALQIGTWDLSLCAAHNQLVGGAVEGHQTPVVQRNVQAAKQRVGRAGAGVNWNAELDVHCIIINQFSDCHHGPVSPEHEAHDVALCCPGPQPHGWWQAAQQLLQVLRY